MSSAWFVVAATALETWTAFRHIELDRHSPPATLGFGLPVRLGKMVLDSPKSAAIKYGGLIWAAF